MDTALLATPVVNQPDSPLSAIRFPSSVPATTTLPLVCQEREQMADWISSFQATRCFRHLTTMRSLAPPVAKVAVSLGCGAMANTCPTWPHIM